MGTVPVAGVGEGGLGLLGDRLVATATDAARNVSKPQRVNFKIVKR
jgi:hypothetical protein